MCGKFGEVETFERKKKEISHWLEDSNQQAISYASKTIAKSKQKAMINHQGNQKCQKSSDLRDTVELKRQR